MENHLGRTLNPTEHVHHINHNKSDNRIENLMVMEAAEHCHWHREERWRLHEAARLREKGLTFTAIGRRFGVDAATVQNGLTRHGLYRAAPAKLWDKLAAASMLRRGIPTRDIASAMGVCHETIQRLARKIGVVLIRGKHQQALS
jgi:IS30 family transposase